MPLSQGTRLGRYVIVSSLGAGGMGEVYRAEDSLLNRQVAVKVLPENLSENSDALRRFEKEAKALAALSHSNVLAIHDFVSEKELSFVVMELLEGETLRSRIARSPLPWHKVVEIATDIAEGLAAAHSKGVIHRDLKPENILLTSTGGVKILDFGLARLKPVVTEAELTEVPTISCATESGIVMGTVPYMSPEQVRGQPADARSDIFSFGCILYEMFAGKRPFSGSNAAETTAAILRDDPAKLTGIPPELERIVQHCLEKDAERRLHSAHDLAFALKDLLAVQSNSVVAAPPLRQRSRAVWITAAVFVVSALLIAMIGLRQKFIGRTPAEKIESLAVLPLKNLSGDPKQEYFADGMTEELIAKLARISALRVISRTSVMEYKGIHKKSLPEIAKELNVDAIVEGSVLHSGNRVRITAQLVHAASDRHLWAESYERDMTDILALQNDVARSIAQEIQIKLTPDDQANLARAPTVHPEAYQAYLRGLEYSRIFGWSEQDGRLAIEMLERAAELDPKFALAYTELARTHSKMVLHGFDTGEKPLKKARAAVDRAFALQPDLPEAHLALGYYHYWGHKDYQLALKEFAIAGKDLPNNTLLLDGTASVQRRQGDFQASIENMRRAVALDPKNAGSAANIGFSYTVTRRYSEAERYYDRAISLAPDASFPYRMKAFNHWARDGSTKKARATLERMPEKQETTGSEGDWFWQEIYERNYQSALDRLSSTSEVPFKDVDEFIPRTLLEGVTYQLMKQPKKALASFDSAGLLLEGELRKRPEDPRVHSSLGIVYAGLGRQKDAIREGKLAVELYPVSRDALEGPAFVQNLALVYVMTGEYDLALDQIEYLLSIPSFFSVSLLRLDPRWDPVRNHPRCAQLVEKYQQERK